MKSGYGGASTAARRFGGTASTAGALYGVLSGAASGEAAAAEAKIDTALLAGKSADEIMDAVVESVRPVDGTQDTEASRASIKDALADLLAKFPEASLLDLTEDQRAFAIERYVAMDVFGRFSLDVGKTIQDKAGTATSGLARLKEVRDYIRETVSAAFKKLGKAGQKLGKTRIVTLAQSVLKETFQVFESYVE